MAPTTQDAEQPDEQHASEAISRIGSRIRTRRREARLTLNDLASQTGVSVSMLSMLERGLASASVGTLIAVASALKIPMQELFEEDGEDDSPVTLKQDQPEIVSAEGVIWRLAHNSPKDGLEVTVNEYEPGTASAENPTHHRGREFGVLIQGTLVIEVNDQAYTLKPGDAIAYDSQIPHRLVNRSRSKARAVWVNLTR
ncbi:XRE family transcriptional regulator [Nocardia sp. CA2R105]|uniref:helix-turn-helix domain-containing protein n=1 Tax=Nocardia coffeae TaxID=2873381 RepID=UPI001CA6F550|nr:XRE family transcriptional regulator [Nocardia coffeae]MBY8863360.1 XRE family transcriptional regulator [Nocardia coffeae]